MKIRGARSIASISISLLIVASLFVIIVNSTGYAEAAEPAPVDPATSTTASSTGSDEVAAASGSNRFVVWQDATTGNYEILFRRSTDNGATWKPLVNLSNNPGDSSDPQIAVSGSNVYVVWLQLDADQTFENVFFRHSADNGATWGAKVKLSSTGADMTPNQKISASGSNVYVVWGDWGLGSDIYFRRSTDNGATWKSEINLSNNPGDSANPELAVSGSNVYVVWSQSNDDNSSFDIFIRRSTDNGATWKSKVNLSNNAGFCGHVRSELAVSGSNVYVVWDDCVTGSQEILLRRSTDGGATWKSVKNLSSPSSGIQPQIAVFGSNVYVTWVQWIEAIASTPGNFDIMSRRSTDNGATWKSIKNLSNNSGGSMNPQIAVSGSNVYVIWEDSTPGSGDQCQGTACDQCDHGSCDILFRRSTDNGATWKLLVNLSNTADNSKLPQIAVSGSIVFVVWNDSHTDAPGGSGFDIFLRRSTDDGAAWKSKVNLSNTGSSGGLVQIAV